MNGAKCVTGDRGMALMWACSARFAEANGMRGPGVSALFGREEGGACVLVGHGALFSALYEGTRFLMLVGWGHRS